MRLWVNSTCGGHEAGVAVPFGVVGVGVGEGVVLPVQIGHSPGDGCGEHAEAGQAGHVEVAAVLTIVEIHSYWRCSVLSGVLSKLLTVRSGSEETVAPRLMLAQEEYVEAHALRKRGWSISAIARHLGRDRKTVRAHLSGEVPARRRPAPDVFDGFEPYVRQRLADDPHVWATVLFDEAKALGYGQSYVTFNRKIRNRGLRPACAACAGNSGPAGGGDHRPSGGRGMPVGLAGAGRHPVGINRVRAGGCAVTFGQVPGVAE